MVALGLDESWGNVCGSPENVRQALGWKAHSSEQNGVALLARYGFAGAEQWQQLDTSLNTSPDDTMWILRVPVCLDAACSQSMPVYVTHWYGTGANGATSYANQARQTVAFLNATSNGLPHILVGDFNVWEGTSNVCNQSPTNNALPNLRSAGYLDAWLTLQGSNEGFTGMANRAGWASRKATPGSASTTRGRCLLPADRHPALRGDAGGRRISSDHYGLVVTLRTRSPARPRLRLRRHRLRRHRLRLRRRPTPAPATSVWTSLVKTVANGATLQKTSGCGECFDGGAIGTVAASGGSVTFSVSSGHRLFVGLGSDLTSSTSYAIDYAFSFWPGGTWEIREKNAYRRRARSRRPTSSRWRSRGRRSSTTRTTRWSTPAPRPSPRRW